MGKDGVWFCVILVRFMIFGIIADATSSFIVSSKFNLKVYWNIPTFQCRSFKLNFTEIASKYGIIQNENDDFRGAKISILYDPGYFPAILNETGKVELRNGGIPQDGDLNVHLKMFKEAIDDKIPDERFTGLGIIDFEKWRPIFRQNFGNLLPYKTMSIEREKKLHPKWLPSWYEKEAQRKFELRAKVFMENTLALAGDLRPYGKWGYYGYPYCFNKSPSNTKQECPPEVEQENNRLTWLFTLSNLLLPSLYLSEKMSTRDKIEMIHGRINEARRVIGNLQNKQGKPEIIPYFWYKYQDTNNFLSKDDLKNSFAVLSNLRVDGLIIWGSSNDVNTKSKCLNMYNYLNNVLGPILVNSV